MSTATHQACVRGMSSFLGTQITHTFLVCYLTAAQAQPKRTCKAPCCSKWHQVPFPCQHIGQVLYGPSLCCMNFAMLLQRTPVSSTYTRALCELQSRVERKLKGFSYYLPVKLRLMAASSISKPAGQGEDPTGLTGTSCHLERPAKYSWGHPETQ